MVFNFSSLSITVPLNDAFPSYQKLAREKARQKLRKEEIALKDVLELPRRREQFKGGVADWVVSTSPIGGGGNYFSLNTGMMLMGGDFNLSGTGNTSTGFQSDQIDYRWHYYFENNKYISQADVGDVSTSGLLARGLTGVKATNEPQIRRKFFQTVDISGHLGQNWEVELYVNNKLIDFTLTDQLGNYRFLLDVCYGSTRIMLKEFGPSGEIHTEERYYSVPQNLVPKGAFEYTAAAGTANVYKDEKKFAHGNVRYGLFENLSLGLSSELPLSSDSADQKVFSGEVTYHPMSNLLLYSGFSPDNLSELTFNFSQPSIVNINGSYTFYYENEQRNPFEQERGYRLSISSPFKVSGHSLGLRFYITSSKYPTFETIDMNYGISTRLLKTHISYMGNYKTTKRTASSEDYVISKWFVTPRFFRWLSPQFRINYDHTNSEINLLGVYFAKRILKKGQLTFSIERNVTMKTNSFMVTFNIFSDFAHFASRLITNNGETAVSQTQSGSVRFDQDQGSFRFIRKSGVGTGTAVIWPFLDENYNGVRDAGESSLPEMKAKLKGGSYGIQRGRDDTYYYDGLLPYDDYLVQIDHTSLDNPQLRPAHENYRVMINPNMVTAINVPVIMAGEVTGVVERQIPGVRVGVGGIRIIITNEQTGSETKVISFNNGEYFYLGLVPGLYRIYLDREQLEKYGYACEPAFKTFQISTVEGGDIIGDMNFLLVPKE